MSDLRPLQHDARRGSFLQEWKRQSQVFWDDNDGDEADFETASEAASDEDEDQLVDETDQDVNEKIST
jgi:hypothetical protein